MLRRVLFSHRRGRRAVRRNPLVMFMCIELMLNAVNLSFVALRRELGDIGGQTAVFFVHGGRRRRGRRRPRHHRVDPPPRPDATADDLAS
jgi:hypothetical protein